MNNRTFRMEKYRFSFLTYLEAATKLAELKPACDYADELQKFFESGQEIGGWHKLTSLTLSETELFLFEHYDSNYTKEGLEKALIRFYAELDIAEANENVLWLRLTQAVKDILPRGEYKDQWKSVFSKGHKMALFVNSIAYSTVRREKTGSVIKLAAVRFK